jgi:hypothetical protein
MTNIDIRLQSKALPSFGRDNIRKPDVINSLTYQLTSLKASGKCQE